MVELVSKQDFRSEVKRRLAFTSERSLFEENTAVISRLAALPEYRAARSVLCYVSVLGSHEVDTRQLIERMLGEGKSVAVPYLDDGAVRASAITSLSDLEPGSFGVLEPKPDLRVPLAPESFDFIIVPGVAFDASCNRLGHGGGHYDRFLPQCRGVKVGLAYSFQMFDLLPRDDWDAALDVVVTNLREYRRIVG